MTMFPYVLLCRRNRQTISRSQFCRIVTYCCGTIFNFTASLNGNPCCQHRHLVTALIIFDGLNWAELQYGNRDLSHKRQSIGCWHDMRRMVHCSDLCTDIRLLRSRNMIIVIVINTIGSYSYSFNLQKSSS